MIPSQKCPHCGVEQAPQIRDGVPICTSCLRPIEGTSSEAPKGMPAIPSVPKSMPSIPHVPQPVVPKTPSIPPIPPQAKPRSNPDLDFELEMREPPSRREDRDEDRERDSTPRRSSRKTKREVVRPERALQQRGLPFELNPNEQVLMRAGFGTLIGRMWLGMMVPVSFMCFGPLSILFAIRSAMKEDFIWVPVWLLLFVFMALMCLWPLLATGKYWLTTERIYWKPRIGKSREMWIQDVHEIYSGGMASSLKIYDAEGNKVAPRFVADLPRLWGGITVLSSMKPRDFVADRSSTIDVSYFRGIRIDGMYNQNGLVVLRPEYVAFLPMGKNIHVGFEFVKQTAGKAVMDALGKKEKFPVEAEMPFDVIVGMMSEQSPKRFDRFIEDSIEEFNGTLVYWDEAKLWRVSIPFSGGRSRIVFESEREKLIGRPGRDQDAFVDAVVHEWNNRKPIPLHYPILRPLIITLILGAIVFGLCYQALKSEGPVTQLGYVNVAQIMDRNQTPEKAFASWTGTPDPSTFTILPKGKNEVDRRALVSCREEPNLILITKERDNLYHYLEDLADTTRPKKKPPTPKKTPTGVERSFSIDGQVFNGDSDGGLNNKIPKQAIRDYAARELGTNDLSNVRIMIVGKTPADDAMAANIGIGFACILGALALFTLILTLRAITLAILKPKDEG